MTLQIIVVTPDGYVDVTPALRMVSPFHVEVDLAALPLSERSRSVDVAWAHVIHYSVPIVQPGTSLCASRVETIETGRAVQYEPFPVPAALQRPRSPVWAALALEYSSNALEAELCAIDPDASSQPNPGGCTIGFVHTSDSDRVIEGIVGESEAQSMIGTRPSHSHNAAALVEQWSSGTDGAAPWPITAKLHTIRVVTSDAYGCLSPVTFSAARRAGSLGKATVERLEPQLRTLDAAVRMLRPRFEPR